MAVGRKTYNADEAVDLLRSAVQTRGADYVYVNPDGEVAAPGAVTTCYYVHGYKTPDSDFEPELTVPSPDATPGCIIGQVFFDATGELLAGVEFASATVALGRTPRYRKVFTDNAVEVLQAAQYRQDNGASWGEALESAEEKLQATKRRGY